ncbi:MAG: TetR/AcrR family transcriptional regulator [Clostridia bacterium]|nr:TetR/AcrR family transcriptional regulator [Clostridia bacterium]
MKIVREPKQERSIEKKNKIITAGYELFSEVGYYNTNTAQIAKRAGVSTGIVYGYFKDKRDILLAVLELYLEKIVEPVMNLLSSLTPPVDYDTLVPEILELTMHAHKAHSKIHEALHSMTHTDAVVNEKFTELEDELTLAVSNKLSLCGEKIENSREKVHLAINIIQSYSHECICDEHCYIDYPVMRAIVEKTIINLFKN